MAENPTAFPPRGLQRRGTMLVATHVAETGMLLLSWICLGRGALSGRLDGGWMAAWALSLASMVPLRSLSTALQGAVAIQLGAWTKQRMLAADLGDGTERIAARGLARRLSELLETAGIDDLAAGGGIAPLLAVIELAVAPLLMVAAGVSAWQVAVLLGWEVLTLGALAQNLMRRARWTRQRLELSRAFVDDLIADRTRAMQASVSARHAEEDARLVQYLESSLALDAATVRIESVLPRSYLITSVVALAADFAGGGAPIGALAVTVGLVLFAREALERLCCGFARPAAAWIAWQLNRRTPPAEPTTDADPPAGAAHAPLLQARDLSFSYPERLHPVLTKCSLAVARGERVLIEGAPGSGKTTLAAILAGLRPASSGYLLASGLDRPTLGDTSWRRRVALVPGYRENHIFSAPLHFNLLLGRQLPYTDADLAEAEAVCRELGLGGLLSRMPAGIHECVGDSHWRLSQGEKSRIFLARALLQNAATVILDENLSALDPENLAQCLECIIRRAPALIMMAAGH